MDGILSEAIGMGIDKLAKREPKTSIQMPSISDLEQSFNRIYGATATEPPPTETAEDKISKGTACIPCSNDHFSTCSGLVSDEAVRFARREGIGSDEVSGRLLRCIDQLNSLEREDLRQENIEALKQPWEKDLAIWAQNQSAQIRHDINDIKTIEDLERVAVMIRETREHLGKEWLRHRLEALTPEQKEQVKARAQQLIEQKLK